MNDSHLAIAIDLDAAALDAIQPAAPAPRPSSADAEPLLDELRQLKAEIRLQTRHLQAIAARLEPLVDFLTGD